MCVPLWTFLLFPTESTPTFPHPTIQTHTQSHFVFLYRPSFPLSSTFCRYLISFLNISQLSSGFSGHERTSSGVHTVMNLFDLQTQTQKISNMQSGLTSPEFFQINNNSTFANWLKLASFPCFRSLFTLLPPNWRVSYKVNKRSRPSTQAFFSVTSLIPLFCAFHIIQSHTHTHTTAKQYDTVFKAWSCY